jgi:hypothetical protein
VDARLRASSREAEADDALAALKRKMNGGA